MIMDENNISGMHIYYYYVCKRKLWYFSNGLAMESENENVKIGKLIDETTYKQKKKHIMIDFMTWLTFNDAGKIIEKRAKYDRYDIFKQLGVTNLPLK